MSKYVMVGCGPAACSAADTIREADAGAEILMLSFETIRTLSRPRLAEYASGALPLADLETKNPAWFDDRRIDVRLGVTVVGADPVAKVLTLGDGETIGYDKLLAACGVRPRPSPFPGSDLDGVCAMHYQDEATCVRAAMPETRRAVVVGGGLLGQDMAMALRSAGRDVTLLVREDRVGVPQWNPGSSEILLTELKGLGIDVRLETEIAHINGTAGRVSAVVTQGGETIPCQMVFVAIGVEPRADWLVGSGVEVALGIVVDEHLKTATSDIFAAGSCAEVHSGSRTFLQTSWSNARAQGKVAGANMAGDVQIYYGPSEYMTKIGDTRFCLFGAPSVAYPKARFVGFRGGEGDYGALLAEGGGVRGGILVGQHKKARDIKALQLRDDPVPGLAELEGQQQQSVDAFITRALGLS